MATVIPIWKDTNTTVGSGSFRGVAVSGSEVLFDEQFYTYPSESNLVLNFNRLAEPYVQPREFSINRNNIAMGTKATEMFKYTATFTGATSANYTWHVADDWSYEERSGSLLNEFLNDEVGPNQFLLFSIQGQGYISCTLNTWNVGTWDYMYTDCWDRVGCSNVTMTQPYNKTWKNNSRIKYVVYYYNRFGGWDFVACKGPVVPTVNTTRESYLQNRRWYRDYQVNVKEGFRLNTGTISDLAAKGVYELIKSPICVVHNLTTDELTVCKPSTTSLECKSFRNQGRKYASYEFEVLAEESKIRR